MLGRDALVWVGEGESLSVWQQSGPAPHDLFGFGLKAWEHVAVRIHRDARSVNDPGARSPLSDGRLASVAALRAHGACHGNVSAVKKSQGRQF